MTTAADDIADEAAFEAFLAGRPAPAQEDGGSPAVAAFAGAVRAAATEPGRPSAALAELLATGLLTDQSSPSTRTATSAGSPPRRSRIRRRRFAVFFPALIAKFLSAGAVAQACTGAGIALVAFTGAGATGLLGEDVQTTISSAVGAADESTADESVTAEETGDPGDVVPPAVETPTSEAPVPSAELRDPLEAQAAGPVEGQTFGDWVHEAFPNGKADGQIVSKWARLKHVDPSEVEGVEGTDDSSTTAATRTPEVETETERTAEATRGSGRGSSGGGATEAGGHGGRGGGNNGGGNSGRGHN